jgi:CPA1 family monovalent cation:H+ antiporter
VRLAQRLQHNIAGILMCEAALQKLRARADLDEAARRALTAIYEERIERRRGRVERIRAVLPHLYERFESSLFSRVTLASAMRTAERRFQQGEIGAKAFTGIEHRLHAALSEVPPLSEAPGGRAPVDLCATVPLLAGLSERSLEDLADRARPVNFLTGDVVIEEGQRGDALYIIAHGRLGAAQRFTDGSDLALRQMGEGEFFGELALLGDQLRTATVTALTPTTLLRLTRRDVLALAGENPEVAQSLEQARRERTAETPETPEGPGSV